MRNTHIREDFPGKVKIRSDGTFAGTEVVVLGEDTAEHKIRTATKVEIGATVGVDDGPLRVVLTIDAVALDVAGVLAATKEPTS